MMSPRPILKRSVATAEPRLPSACVHFPPSPALTRTFTAHSSAVYDRSPIVVSRNSCALPERGCPGRTYLLDEQGFPAPKDYHPRALAFSHRASTSHYPPVPALVPDLSSESEESDSWSCLTGDLLSSPSTAFSIHGLKAGAEDPSLAFLPYSPSASPSKCHLQEDDEGPFHSSKPRRKRTDRRHESSRDLDRIPRTPSPISVDPTLGMGALSISPPSPLRSSPTRKKGVRTHHQLTVLSPTATAAFGFAATDDGCLGGF